MTHMDDWNDERLLTEAERWTWWPPDTTVIEEPAYLLTLWTEDPARNLVHWTHAADDTADAGVAVIGEVLQRLRAAGRTGVRWWVTEATRPTNLEDLLLRRGFQEAERVDILTWDLGTGAEAALPALDVPPDVTTELVRDEATLRAMHELAARGFGEAPPTEEQLRHYARELEEQERTGRRTSFEFVASVDGRPVSSAGFTLVGQVARFWGAATLPEARGKGAYRALVAARCAEARRRGARVALTKARVGTSGPILRRAGFRALGQERCYTLTW